MSEDTSANTSTVNDLKSMVAKLGGHTKRFGVLAASDTTQLTVIARNMDVAVGDLFLLPCERGHPRFYVFRATEYANVMNRTLDPDDIARNKLTMADSFLAKDLQEQNLIQLKGIVLGYSEYKSSSDSWTFNRPRRLPEHLTDVYRVIPGDSSVAEVVRLLLGQQLGQDGLFIGNLLAGESALDGVPVQIPPFALSHHLAIFGRTGCGKSNMMMVFLRSIMDHNQSCSEGKRTDPRCSILAIDPHDEFYSWHAKTGGKDGIRGIINGYNEEQKKDLVDPFYYLTAKDPETPGLEQRIKLSRADIHPQDVASVLDITDQQISFAERVFSEHGDRWITEVLLLDADDDDQRMDFHPGTVEAVKRRLSFLQRGSHRIFTNYDAQAGIAYDSSLPEIICALEKGRLLVVDTTLMSEMEQFVFTTVVARVLFTLRKALRTAGSAANVEKEIRTAFGNVDEDGLIGMQSLVDALIEKLNSGELPYKEGETLTPPDQLPFVNIVIEEAPSVLNPQRIKFGSVFRDISRQGRKFGIGLTVVSQQVTAIDEGILTQVNTEFNMALGNEEERRSAIRNASADLRGFERELQVMGKGQVILSASYKDIPLPVQAPNYDTL